MTEHESAPTPRVEVSNADPGSFRDPGGRVFLRDGEVYRTLDEHALANWEALAATTFFPQYVAAGRIVATERVDDVALAGDWAGVLHHERIPVITYPYEWTFSMLRDAALLQLDLLSAALAEGMILKDSTPFNIQWRGHEPVFIDIGSFETLDKGDIWVGYRQFLSQYLYPLMLTANVGIAFQPWLRGRPDGITAEQMHAVMGSKSRLLSKSGLLHVTLPARTERSGRGKGRDVRSEYKEAGFSKEMIEANVKGLRSIVEKLSWTPDTSRWNRYAADCEHVHLQRDAKAEFVAGVLEEGPFDTVWDVGANDGHFSNLAAHHAGYVLALDADELVLDELFRSLHTNGPANVLPLIQDLADPSPGIGWRGMERPPLVQRSSPDLVLALAVVHHLVIGRNVPLRAFVDWMADLNARIVFEFVPPDDPMVLALTANKKPHEIHRDYTEDSLREYLEDRFVIEREQAVPAGERRLFSLVPIV
ncbi:MAG: class I SAM-dependent methyltransferase [Actinomycetota bacterium]